MILYLNYTHPKLQLNMSLQWRARYKYHKTKWKSKKKFNALIMLFWMLIYLVFKDENIYTILVLTCSLFQLWRLVLIFPLAKNWEQGKMFYPMCPKGHFYVLSSLTHKLCQFLELMPHNKIAPHFISIFHICLEFARFGIWLNLAHEGNIMFLFHVFVLFILKD
jgi:hypothetical protein